MQFLVLYKTLLALPYSSPAFYTKLETPTIFGHHFFLFLFPFPFSFSIPCSFYCLYCLLHFFLFPFYSHKKLIQVQKKKKKKSSWTPTRQMTTWRRWTNPGRGSASVMTPSPTRRRCLMIGRAPGTERSMHPQGSVGCNCPTCFLF